MKNMTCSIKSCSSETQALAKLTSSASILRKNSQEIRSQRLALSTHLNISNWKTKILNVKSGILQAKKGIEPLQTHIIEELSEQL